jgi:DNA invertase Pin-like site-specific DNA recombinase
MTEQSIYLQEHLDRVAHIQNESTKDELEKAAEDIREKFEAKGIRIITSQEDAANLQNLNHRAVGYARYSSKMQRDGFSIEAQINEIMRECRANDEDLGAVFVDLAQSAYSSHNRPGLDALKKLAENLGIDNLYVHKMDRLSRNLRDTIQMVDDFEKKSVRLRFVEQNFDTTTPSGKLAFHLFAMLNEHYSANLSRETIKGRYEKASQGYHNGFPPFGYVAVPEKGNPKRKVGVPIPEYREIIVELFTKYASGQYSFRDLARWLNSQGIKNNRGANFRKDSVRDMIRNPYYIGKIRYKGAKAKKGNETYRSTKPIIFEGRHEAIISEELWDQCQKIRKRRSNISKKKKPTKRIFLLNGIIHCAECGLRLRAQTCKGTYFYYRDVSELRGNTCKHSGTSVSSVEIDAQIARFIQNLRLPQNWRQAIESQITSQPQSDLEVQIKTLKRELKRHMDLYKVCLESQTNEIMTTIMNLKKKIQILEVQQDKEYEIPAQRIISISESWGKATKAEQRKLIHSIIKRVVCDLGTGKVLWVEPWPEYKPLFIFSWPDHVDETGRYWFSE